MGCPRHAYIFLLLCSFFALVEAGRGRQALEEMKRRQASARKSMEERVQRANRQRPNNGKPRKNPAAKVVSATANVAAAAAFDGAFTAEEAIVPAAAPPTTQPTDVLVDLRARLANLKRDIEKHAAGARA